MNQLDWWKTGQRIFWAVIIIGLGVLVVRAVEQKKETDAPAVVIQIEKLSDGTSLLTEEDVLMTISRSFGFNLDGVPIGKVDIERVERVLEEAPFILGADVYVDARNKIHIDVVQRHPILRIIDRDGLEYYLDKDGFKMPLSKHYSARVLVASGNIAPFTPEYREKKHILNNLFDLAQLIRGDGFLVAQTEQIYVDGSKELSIIPKVGNHRILLGKYADMEDKLKRLKIFYKEGMPYEGWNKYKSIDLRYKGQVVCKKR